MDSSPNTWRNQHRSSASIAESQKTQETSDSKSATSNWLADSPASRAHSTGDPFSPAKVLRQLGPFEVDSQPTPSSQRPTATTPSSRGNVTPRRYRISQIVQRQVDPRAKLEEFRRQFQHSRHALTPHRSMEPVSTIDDFAFRQRRDFRHNDPEDFDDALTFKSYSTDTNFSEFNHYSQQQPTQRTSDTSTSRIIQQQQQHYSQQPGDSDDDADLFSPPSVAWRPPPSPQLGFQAPSKRRRLSRASIASELSGRRDASMGSIATTPQRRISFRRDSQEASTASELFDHEQLKEQVRRERIEQQEQQQRRESIAAYQKHRTPSTIPSQASSSHQEAAAEMRQPTPTTKAPIPSSSVQQQQQQQQQQSAVSEHVQDTLSQRSQKSQEKGKGRAQPSQSKSPSSYTSQHQERHKEPSPAEQYTELEIDMDFSDNDLDFGDVGYDDYGVETEQQPQQQQQQEKQSTQQRIDYNETVSRSEDRMDLTEEPRKPESPDQPSREQEAGSELSKRFSIEEVQKVGPDRRYGVKILQELEQQRLDGNKRSQIDTSLRPLATALFRKSGLRVPKKLSEQLGRISDAFYKQAIDDVTTYAKHAGRRQITKDDTNLLLRRQERLTDENSIGSLAHKYLPRELWDSLCVSAVAYNDTYPSKSDDDDE